jgi:hypothetical protein
METRQIDPSPASDAGGVAARQGFKYQDHVAAHFVLQMVTDLRLLRVECETADDIVLVWAGISAEEHEYVQVKTTELDKKWSQAEICKRENPHRPTSLAEKSLLCDRSGARALFRIVSRRAVDRRLSCLTLPREGRVANAAVTELAEKLAKEWRTTSQNGNDLAYWTRHVVWQVTGDIEALAARNQQALALLAEQYGTNPTHRHVTSMYQDLLALVDRAAAASRTTAPDRKVIMRGAAMDWWANHLAQTEAAVRQTSKPYRVTTAGFFAELHHVAEEDIGRALTGYDARYEMRRWRSLQLAEYLADWLPEIALKASELVQVQHLNLRQKLRAAVREIERHRDVEIGRLLAEMLLHAVLRHQFQSEPIACKLFYRTASGRTRTFGNAHIIRLHGERDELWLGRATLATAASYEAVLASVLSELSGILDPDFLNEEREVILSLREPQHLLPTTLEEALARNSPVDDLLNAVCIPILIAYDSEVLGGGFTADYCDRLIQEVTERYETIKPALPEAVETVKVHILLVPIECVATLVQQFAEQIKGC